MQCLLEQENEVLRRAAALFVPGESPGKRLYPLVRELAVDGISISVSLRVLKLSRAPYYRWLKQPVSDTEWREAYWANALYDAHKDDPQFGYRLLADEAEDAGQDRVEDLLRKPVVVHFWEEEGRREETRPARYLCAMR